MPHSKTSMIAEYLLKNGLKSADDIQTTPNKHGYSNYESLKLSKILADGGDPEQIKEYLASLPDYPLFLKNPGSILHIGKFITERPIKLVFIMRNMLEVLKSTKVKRAKSSKIALIYQYWISYNNAMAFPGEKIIIFAEDPEYDRLLAFCGISPTTHRPIYYIPKTVGYIQFKMRYLLLRFISRYI